MTPYQEKVFNENAQLTKLTKEIADALGAPWQVRKPRPDRDEENYPTRWIVNGEGAELWVRIESYGAQKGRVSVSGSLNVGKNGQYETVYENGNRVNSPDISVNPARGAEVIAKEIKRRLLPDYLRILALAQAQAIRHNEQTARRQATMHKLAEIAGTTMDFEKEPDRDRMYLPGARSGTVQVHYDGDVYFERLSVTQGEAEHILRYLYRNQNAISE